MQCPRNPSLQKTLTRPFAPQGAGPARIRTARLEGTKLIALFDSGIGGLTVLAALRRRLPRRDYLYLSDQRHFPYGDRPVQEIREDVGRFARHARDEGAETLVLACNTASAIALDAAREAFQGVVHGVIAPVAAATRGFRRVGVLATTNTCRTHAYRKALGARVLEVACPELIALAEVGGASDEDVGAQAERPLWTLRAAGCDVVVLGCTHLPHFERVLTELTRPWATLVDPGECLATDLARELLPREESGRLVARTTGDPAVFQKRLSEALPELAQRASTQRLRVTDDGALFVDEESAR